MSSVRNVGRVLGPAALALSLLTVGAAGAQSAQSSTDPRFQPWIGCWRPLDSGLGLEELDGEKQPTRACVVPSSSTRGSVDLVLFHRDSVMSRTPVPLPGSAVPRRVEECEGTERADWSPDNARLVLTAELTCARGVKRVETGMLSMNEAGQWVQLQHLLVGKNEATTVARFRFEGDGAAPAGVDLGGVRSTRALRTAMGGAVSVDDIIATTRLVPPSLAEAWLAEMGQRIALDAKTLVKMADSGVSSRTIDVMVALANPDKFQIAPAMTNSAGTREGAGIVALRTGTRGGGVSRSRCQMMDDFCYGPGGMGAWGFGYRYGMFDPWGFGYFNPYRYGLGGWGLNAFSPWGNPWGGWGQGWGPGWGPIGTGGPVVIIPGGGGGNAGDGGPVRGRAVNGGGYTRASSPYNGPSGSMSPSPSYSPSTGGGGGGSIGGSAGGASSGGGDGGRTAKPRGGL